MTASTLTLRVSLARLEGALIQSGYANHDNVAVRIAEGEDPAAVQKAVGAICNQASSLDQLRTNSNDAVQLQAMHAHSQEFTHAVVPGTLIDVPDTIRKILHEFKKHLPLEQDGSVKASEIGWVLGIESVGGHAPAIVLRITTGRALKNGVKPASFAREVSAALGVSVRIDLGQLASAQSDRWAHKNHSSIAPGMSVGSQLSLPNAVGATVTIPVRRNGALNGYHFITAAHAFHEFRSHEPIKIRQPIENTNIDRIIGEIVNKEYYPATESVNFIDAALIQTNQVPSRIFGVDGRHQIDGIFSGMPNSSHRAFIYGATSGLVPVKISNITDIIVTILSNSGARLIYRDVIEISRDEFNVKPASVKGDSGAPLLIRTGERFQVAGMIVGGGLRKAESRQPRSYAIPIERILNHFDVELW